MVTLEGIVFWNNQPDREASSLVRKGVGRNTILRAVETPYPTVNPIQSNPMQIPGSKLHLQNTTLMFHKAAKHCWILSFRITQPK